MWPQAMTRESVDTGKGIDGRRRSGQNIAEVAEQRDSRLEHVPRGWARAASMTELRRSDRADADEPRPRSQRLGRPVSQGVVRESEKRPAKAQVKEGEIDVQLQPVAAQPAGAPVDLTAGSTIPAIVQLRDGKSLRVRVAKTRSASNLRVMLHEATRAEGECLPEDATLEILRSDGVTEMLTAFTDPAVLNDARAVTVFRTRISSQLEVMARAAEDDRGWDAQTCMCHLILTASTLGMWTPCWCSYCWCKDRTGACCARPQDACIGAETSNRDADAALGERFRNLERKDTRVFVK